MNVSGQQPMLRPLGLGEVLDRAVTLSVKHFVPFALILVVYTIPLGIVQYFATADFARIMHTITATIAAQAAAGKPADPKVLSQALGSGQPLNGWYGLLGMLVFFVGPLPAAALIVACAAFYLGRSVTFGEAYRTALGRWLPLVGINLLYLGAGLLLYMVLVLLGVALIFGIVLITTALHAVGIALAVIVSLLATVLAVAFFIVAALAMQVSYFTCVVEGAGAVAAFSRGLRRVFVGVGLSRSLLVGAAFLAIGIGITMLSFVGESVLLGLLQNSIASTAYATVLRIATAAFTTAFVAIFYFDLRVREEGFDLQLDADRMRAPAMPAANESA